MKATLTDGMCLSMLSLQTVLLLVFDVSGPVMRRTMMHQFWVLAVMFDDLLGHLVQGGDGSWSRAGNPSVSMGILSACLA